MTPIPISPSTIHTVLQYISPPSQLDQPLPPYLLSKSLLQRHHFLHISPDEPQEYLCWQTSSPEQAAEAIRLLEATSRPADEDVPPEHPIQYTADDENVFAHVNLTSTGDHGVRLVFQWDDLDGWKYHDASLMPFPPGSQKSLPDVLEEAGVSERIQVPSTEHNSYGFDPQTCESDDDDYWNAYGAHDMSVDSSDHHVAQSAKDVGGNSEDAYWARYNSVHGTADSTRPSPLPSHRRKPNVYDQLPTDPDSPHPLPVPVRIEGEDSYYDDAAIPIPPSGLTRPTIRTPWDPASPETLSRLLSAISPRQSPRHSLTLLSDIDAEVDSLSPPTDGSFGSEESDTPALGLIPQSEPDTDSLILPSVDEVAQSESIHSVEEPDTSPSPVDQGLREGLRGLYTLWKVSRSGSASPLSDREAFMSIVEEVIR